MVFSKKLNDIIIEEYRKSYKTNFEGGKVNKCKYLLFKVLDNINNVKLVLSFAIVLASIVIMMYVDYNTTNFFRDIAVEYWITFLSICIPPILIWYITIKSEKRKSINNSKIELLVLIIKLRIEGQKIYQFSNIAKEKDSDFEKVFEMEFSNDGKKESISSIITSSRLTTREVMIIYMSLEFNHCNSAIMYNTKEVNEVNQIQNDYLTIDCWDELINIAQRHVELTEYLEHILRTYK